MQQTCNPDKMPRAGSTSHHRKIRSSGAQSTVLWHVYGDEDWRLPPYTGTQNLD